MPELEITRLETAGDAAGRLRGSVVHTLGSSPFSLKVAGWALGPRGRPRGIGLVAAEHLADRTVRHDINATAPNVPRPDVMEQFPDIPAGKPCGFVTACSLLGLPCDFHVLVEARFEDGPVTLAEIEGRRRPLRTGYEPAYAPILLKTLGRAGSTWMTHVIGAHPQAVAYRAFEYEPRMLDYWLEIVRLLTGPHAYAQSIAPDVRDAPWWDGRARWLGPLSMKGEPEVERWVETESVDEFAAFAQQRVDTFYGRVAKSQEKSQTVRFVERAHERPEWVMAQELYDDVRTVFLVRDPRDLLVSRLAFNRRTGQPQFGYDRAASPEEYVGGAMRAEVEEWMESWRRGRDGLLVRYEDLMTNPETTLHDVFEHASLDSSPQVVTATLERARATKDERQARHKTSPGGTGSIGRWREDLSPALQNACTEAFGDALESLGYEPART